MLPASPPLRRPLAPAPARASVVALAALLALAGPAAASRVVVIDPGHGGEAESPGPFTGDHWDPAARAFLYPFNFGAADAGSGLEERRIVLAIARRVRDLLASASTPAGFPAFRRLLERHGRPANGRAFPRPDIRVVMTRESSVDAPEFDGVRDANRFFRLYDSPTGFRDDGAPHPDLHPGRMSLINRAKPELSVSIHVNSSKSAALRGQAAVVTPNGRLFEWLRDLRRDHGPRADALLDRLDWFFDRTPILSNVKGLAADAGTYFDEGAKVPRHARVTWRYKRSARDFRDRERSSAETARRGGGASLGGDNLYASDETVRFIRLALARRLAEREPARRGEPADQVLGPHGRPFARDYAIPLFVNAVSCYVEIGYLSNAEDRRLLVALEEAYAEGIAVAVYSLLYGMDARRAAAEGALAGLAAPAGRPIDLKRYRRGRDYFQEVFPRDCAIPERVLAFRERIETLPSGKSRPGDPPLAAGPTATPPPRAVAGTADEPSTKAKAKAKPDGKGKAAAKGKGKGKAPGKGKPRAKPKGKGGAKGGAGAGRKR